MGKKKRQTVPVTLRAAILRINRKLKPEYLQLKKTRGTQWHSDLGGYYVLNLYHNSIADHHVDPEAYGRELGVIAEWEHVVE